MLLTLLKKMLSPGGEMGSRRGRADMAYLRSRAYEMRRLRYMWAVSLTGYRGKYRNTQARRHARTHARVWLFCRLNLLFWVQRVVKLSPHDFWSGPPALILIHVCLPVLGDLYWPGYLPAPSHGLRVLLGWFLTGRVSEEVNVKQLWVAL